VEHFSVDSIIKPEVVHDSGHFLFIKAIALQARSKCRSRTAKNCRKIDLHLHPTTPAGASDAFCIGA
jgi:hypothetical protein